MPWQLGETGRIYYAQEEAVLLPNEFRRLHKNEWVTSSEAFIEPAWWTACKEDLAFDQWEPVILGVDAATTDDCFAIVGVSRHPNHERRDTDVGVRFVKIYRAPKGGKINFELPEDYIRDLCDDYNITTVVYDEYQLHDMASRLRKESVGAFKPFSQMGARIEADTDLRRLIMRRGIAHDGDEDLTRHINNAAAKLDGNDKKLRIVKKSAARKIDAAVALSMAAYECLRLNL
jgi:phage terminase large subunit-like protein